MSRRARRALVLAAGFGRRLAPLTAEVPKPLLPVAGRPLVAWTLDALVDAGCEAIAVNLHHLGETIPAALGERHRRVPLHYSREPEILGTLGAVGPLRDFLGEAGEILLVNGDSLCRWPLRTLVERHRRTGAAATLLVAERADPRGFGGGVALAEDGRVLAFRSASLAAAIARRRRVFAGAQVWRPELLARVPEGFADTICDLYEPLLTEGAEIQSLATRRPWHDLGTPARYLAGALAWGLAGLPASGVRLAPGATIERGARVRRSVLEAGATVAGRSRVEGSLLLPGARVGAGAEIRDSILGPGVEVPPGMVATAVLLTVGEAGSVLSTPLARG
ncbi:MAG TPA: NDP-sugar synthase [Thermoanaerobaculia bacterium]|nr:NDP-sugar synthase [Thermoanaerobaculia bacterium]